MQYQIIETEGNPRNECCEVVHKVEFSGTRKAVKEAARNWAKITGNWVSVYEAGYLECTFEFDGEDCRSCI